LREGTVRKRAHLLLQPDARERRLRVLLRHGLHIFIELVDQWDAVRDWYLEDVVDWDLVDLVDQTAQTRAVADDQHIPPRSQVLQNV
jgi:hypothetical protein